MGKPLPLKPVVVKKGFATEKLEPPKSIHELAYKIDETYYDEIDSISSTMFKIGRLIDLYVKTSKARVDKGFFKELSRLLESGISNKRLSEYYNAWIRFSEVFGKCEWRKCKPSVLFEICKRDLFLKQRLHTINLAVLNNWGWKDVKEYFGGGEGGSGRGSLTCICCDNRLYWRDKGKTWGFHPLCDDCYGEIVGGGSET